MKEPTRLIHEDPGFARLVAASSAEEPSSGQLDKALALASHAAASSRWSLGWRGGLGAHLALGVAAVGVVLAGVAGIRGARSESDVAVASAIVAQAVPIAAAPSAASPAVVVEAVPGATSPGAPPPAVVELAAPPVSVNDLVDAPRLAAGAPSRSSARSGAEPASADEGTPAALGAEPGARRGTFREELALVSAARSALETGDAAGCMRAVARYDERFQAGIFAHEIEVLRIEALAASGERVSARARAERFLATNAESPYAERVRSLLERTANRP
ncbi:MAG: hypothetical protein KF795_32600 [Labilithrix sp.]|nr:hypothetical protein [Labilithrix sp.]